MLRPAIGQILKNNESYYSLVLAVAKRARDITDEANEKGIILNEKPVKTAVDEFASNEYRFVEDPELRR